MITASSLSSLPDGYTLLATTSQELKDLGVQIYVLGVGPEVEDQQLNDVASGPQNIYRVPLSRLPNFGPKLWDSWRDYIRRRGKFVIALAPQFTCIWYKKKRLAKVLNFR